MRRSACIIAVGTWGGSRCLLKHRDRNYQPKVKVIHEIRKGVEVLYMQDEVTGWIEGLNEFGIGVVNSALSVRRDETEKKVVKNEGKKSKDGEKILRALEQKSLDKAVDVACEFKGGIQGHTFVSDPSATKSVEQTSQHECIVRNVGAADKIHVRTNHGLAHDDAGYTEGPDLASSLYRRERAMKVLRSVEEPGKIAPTLYREYKGENVPNSLVRKTDNMRTTSQMVLDLDELVMRLYILPGEATFEGVEDKLPEGYKPKLELMVFRYDDVEDFSKAKARQLKTAAARVARRWVSRAT